MNIINIYQQILLFKKCHFIFTSKLKQSAMTTIYVLLENDQIRYIGKTTKKDLQEKLDQHLDEAQANPKKFEWIGNLFKEGKTPEIKPVFKYQDNEADYYEKLFISDYKFFSGLKLTNQEYYKPEQLSQKYKNFQESNS
jgi:hypothetical protein